MGRCDPAPDQVLSVFFREDAYPPCSDFATNHEYYVGASALQVGIMY